MIDTVRQLLVNQYEAALSTLCLCIRECPEDAWDVKIGNGPFQWVAFHTLFFTDLYLSGDEQTFRSQQFHKDHVEHFGNYIELQNVTPVTVFERQFINQYLEHCLKLVKEVMAKETEQTLAESCGFGRKQLSRAELHLYNIRHVQHHAAHLSLRLRLDYGIDIPWVGSGRPD